MPVENTDAQNNWLYATNILLHEMVNNMSSTDAFVELGNLRDKFYDEDGKWTVESASGRTIAQMIDIINNDPFLDSDEWRDAVEKRKWPDRIELSDIAFWWSENNDSHGDNHVWLNDGRLVNRHFDPIKPIALDITSVRNAQESKIWPNRIELFDINFIGSSDREAVYTEQGTFYSAGRGNYPYPWKWPIADTRNFYEEQRWPDRITMDDVAFISDCYFEDHPNCTHVAIKGQLFVSSPDSPYNDNEFNKI